jgi:ATP synthase protein I
MSNTPEKPNKDKSTQSGNALPKETEFTARLDDLGSRIQAKQKKYKKVEDVDSDENSQGVAQAMRLSSEFIAGVCVGAGIGYLFDKFLDTSPWGMIVFLFLGFGAGVLNALRSAGLMAESSMHLGADAKKRRNK